MPASCPACGITIPSQMIAGIHQARLMCPRCGTPLEFLYSFSRPLLLMGLPVQSASNSVSRQIGGIHQEKSGDFSAGV